MNAQNISRYTFSSAGGFYNENITMDYSVGQIITPLVNSSQILTSGFQQPNFSKAVETPKEVEINCELSIYPNPTNNFANLILTSEFEINDIDVKVFDITGKEIFPPINKFELSNYTKISIDFSNESIGEYIIHTTINQTVTQQSTIIRF